MRIEDRSAFQAGEWKVEPELNSLTRAGVERHVEPKAMQVLLILASREAHVFSKEELLSAVWPHTYVSEDVLTRCISILRRVTEDDPRDPRFIRTIPKVGYRLVAPVAPLIADPDLPSPVDTVETVEAPQQTPLPSASTSLDGVLPWRLRWVSIGAVALIAVVLAVYAYAHRSRPPNAAVQSAYRMIQFTSYVGEQTQPSFSPGGTSVAFVRIGEGGTSRRVYIKRIGTEALTELTTDHDQQYSPVWSPDGKQIAYLARSPAGLAIDLAEVGSSQASHRVFTPQEPSDWEDGALSWSPDGSNLIFPDHTGSQAYSRIVRLDLHTLQARPITSPPPGWEGDLNPAYSPDGKRIAFTRASETAVREIYWISVADGRLHRLTNDRSNIGSLTWSADGASVIFSSSRGGKSALWQIAASGGAPQRLPFGTEDAFQPAVGPLPGLFAYAQGSSLWSIVRLRNGSTEREQPPQQTVLSSTQHDSAPSLAPDGQFFALQSLRSGSQEIWIAPTQGHAAGTDGLRQLTFLSSLTGSPAWSNHGDSILFDSRPDGHSHIFEVAAAGGAPRQLTSGDANDIVPRWSHDDQTVFFRSNRGGQWRLWRIPAGGGEPQAVTQGDGIEPQQSADGRWLYFTRGDQSGLWRVPAAGGVETRVLDQPAAGYWGYWQLTARGIYYLDLSRSQASIRILDPETRQTSLVSTLTGPPPLYAGLSVSEDGQIVLTTEERDAERHITLVKAQ